jgi:hypothetical protein
MSARMSFITSARQRCCAARHACSRPRSSGSHARSHSVASLPVSLRFFNADANSSKSSVRSDAAA